jgi:hypothetical protein
MDDRKISIPANRCVIRQCEAVRLQSQLLAQAYQQVFPQVRRPLAETRVTSAVSDLPPLYKAAVAAGA